MAENVVYELQCITDNPKFEGFAFKNRRHRKLGDDLGSAFLPDDMSTRAWEAPRLASVWTPQPVEGRVRPINDYPCVDLSIPAFSRRAVDVLREFLQPNGELLPLVSRVGDYFAYNVTTVADILDRKKSKVKWYDDSEQIIAVEISRYEFRPSRLRALTIFRLVEQPALTYVTQKFVDLVKDHDLQGFHFIKLWPLAARSTWRKEDRKEQTRNARVTTKRGRRSAIGNTLVFMLPTRRAKPGNTEKARIEALLDALDGLLYKQDSRAAYFGSVEGHDHHNGHYRVFLSCPDADALVEHLRPWLKALTWKPRPRIVKRYGAYDDLTCREQGVEV